MSFWNEFASADNSKVHTPQMILFGIGTILMLFSLILLIYHCLYHGKGIDSETVKLIGLLLGGGCFNAGASFFQKTTVSSVTGMVSGSQSPDAPATAKKAPPIGDGL